MIHYHGGVMAEQYLASYAAGDPDADLREMAGRCFCVSYAYPGPVARYHRMGQSVLLDNGAFSIWKQGDKPDWKGFYKWAEEWLQYWSTWAIIPDVIGGDEADNDKLVKEWPFPSDRGAPVWHPHESLERLERLCEEWWLVCIGGSSYYEPIAGERWTRRMEEAMDRICDSDGLPKTRLHMLRGLRFSGGPYPLFSADSATIARGHHGSLVGTKPKDVVRLYQEVDGKQPPTRWHRPGDLEGLFDVPAGEREAQAKRRANLIPVTRLPQEELFSE